MSDDNTPDYIEFRSLVTLTESVQKYDILTMRAYTEAKRARTEGKESVEPTYPTGGVAIGRIKLIARRK